jgi:hypothetical protein
MYTEAEIPVPELFAPHPHFCDSINHNIIQSEIEGGVYLPDLAQGEAVEIETQNHVYTLVNCGENAALICGHPKFCPEPVKVSIHGSTWGGSLLKQGFIGRTMHLEFGHPDYTSPIVTSRIVDVRPTQHSAA